MTVHEQRQITYQDPVLGEITAEVDVDLCLLILACWKARIATSESCQEFTGPTVDGEPHTVFLAFEEPEDYVRFGELLLAGGDRDDLYERVQDGWEWTAHPIEFDETAGWPERRPDSEPIVSRWMCNVVFPREDLDAAVIRLT